MLRMNGNYRPLHEDYVILYGLRHRLRYEIKGLPQPMEI